MSESNQCRLCKNNPETITHLFSECRETLELWTNVEYWILTRTGTSIKFDTTMKILGYHKYDSNFWPVNFWPVNLSQLDTTYLSALNKKKH